MTSASRSGKQPEKSRESRPSRRPASSSVQSGLALKIQRSTLAPADVHNGEQITLTLQYVDQWRPRTRGDDPGKKFPERDGKELTVLKDESSEKENGTWENTLSFSVPESAKPGKYMVTLQISAQGQTRSARRSFTVR